MKSIESRSTTATSSPPRPAADAATRTAPTGKDGAKAAGAVEASAKVELSAAASLLAAEGNTADFDAREGGPHRRRPSATASSKVNAEAIADKLIAHTRDLLTPRSH